MHILLCVYVKGCKLQKTWRLEAHLWKYVPVAECNKNQKLLALLTFMNPYIVIYHGVMTPAGSNLGEY
jgi:hypothetical protein